MISLLSRIRLWTSGGHSGIRVSRRTFFHKRATSVKGLASNAYVGKKSVYPERLLIYHAGVGKTVFIGCLKLTTIFLFSFSCLVIAPSFYHDLHEPNWLSAAAIAGGAVPMAFVAYTSAPFVIYVHIHLPVFARQSREQLIRWSKNMPPSTEIDVTTMRFTTLPRASRIRVQDLQTKRGRLGVANLARTLDATSAVTKRPWYLARTPSQFYVGKQNSKSREPSVWQYVLSRIRES